MPSVLMSSSYEPSRDSNNSNNNNNNTTTASNNNHHLCASYNDTAVCNRHSHSYQSEINRHHSISSIRVKGRWRPTSARSARSAHGSEHLRRRSPSPMFTRFTRGPRQRQNDGAGAPVTRSRSGTTGSKQSKASHGRSRRNSYITGQRVSIFGSNPPPPLTPEEFEALPVAIQRKYFSTLERLRFAQSSPGGNVDGISKHYDAITVQNLQRHGTRQGRIASESAVIRPYRKRSLGENNSYLGASEVDSLFYAELPEKIRNRELSRDEQVLLAGQLRASVILDAADEALQKIGQCSSNSNRLDAPEFISDTPRTSTSRLSRDTMASSDPRHPRRDALGLELGSSPSPFSPKSASSSVPESFYDSFHWLEDDEDLDLSLCLDDYHSNLRDQLPPSNKERVPSFRRNLSVSKMPFNRPSQSAAGGSASGSRPATNNGAPTRKSKPQSPALPSPSSASMQFPSLPHVTVDSASAGPASTAQTRRKSRALSLIAPKQSSSMAPTLAPIDPSAAHYQDPEARLKLREYLASPQKFDEAIEFGFPSLEAPCTTPATTQSVAERRHRKTPQNPIKGTNNMCTFLVADEDDEDDNDRPESDQASIPDPDSPKTPQLIPDVPAGLAGSVSGVSGKAPFRPYRLSADPSQSHRSSESYGQTPGHSREMTLRMTLTRLDLRAGEESIYGWQKPQYQVQSHGNAQQPRPSYSRKSSSTHNYTLRDGGSEDLLSDGPMAKGTSGASAAPAAYVARDGSGPKPSIENVFAGIDHWEETQDKNVMKRLWNRVRRS